ncbi:acyltransferase family protein [Paraburkholderia megapolitana]|uniref:Peptidoglycan/LPS O-acetylase OafA/YrhL, contains acyltransferase and SGNH-hydrolase domains n=1 Tax=Paraburkholderia megapolitana TaxID=420953 RepID=A0A1I3MR62_9BURK|nr:acyltransferase family protein [Paraburkholderia megapolitana]QDQ84095.1 acyltransferase [Paraburkholderia megapolitana]SFI99156.1 Peptidoglycan/LPS O-acetylase OafA/YrhL, contains acyltransferase and SGNH-hydrolase domains [Paraburkholderia megapolitana]
MSKQTRRPDIDGLRAVAILSVMAFHFNPRWLPGGFAGVDIFFVISAYLITSIIHAGMLDGSFSYQAFYVRRIKRIFPASILVFGVTAFLASQLNGLLLSDAKYVLLFLFNSHTSNYFTQNSQTNFFLHYWSLSIEEQFYFIWPPLLGLALWGGAHLFGPNTCRRWLRALPLAIAVTGFVLGEIWVHDPASSGTAYFYSMPRFGELAIGAFAALLPRSPSLGRLAGNLLSAAGALAIALAFVFLDEKVYPGVQALLPCVGAALILYCWNPAGGVALVNRVLGSRPLVLIGLISYSLYLWHWPVLSIMRFWRGQNALPASWMASALGLIFLLSIATYHFVEQPFIRSKPGFKVVFPAFVSTTLAGVALILMMTGVDAYNIAPVLGRTFTNVTIDGQNTHLTSGWIDPCFDKSFHGKSKDVVDRTCAIGAARSPSILLVGDSHGAAIGAFMDQLGKREGFALTSYEVGACQIAEWGLAARAPDVVRTPERIRNCQDMLAFIKANHEKYQAIFVVNAFNLFAGDYNVFSHAPEAAPSVRVDILSEIAKTTPIYFFYDSPVIDRSIQYSPFFAWLHLPTGGYPVKDGDRGNPLIARAVASIPGAHWIDLGDSYHALTKDHFVYKGYPVYVDSNHLNGYGARSLADIFIQGDDACFFCRVLTAQSSR